MVRRFAGFIWAKGNGRFWTMRIIIGLAISNGTSRETEKNSMLSEAPKTGLGGQSC
jgi:hypothetical protein